MAGNKKYYLGLSDRPNEYRICYLLEGSMIYLRRYNDSVIAVSDLDRYNLIGTSDVIGSSILNQLVIYVYGDIDVRDFILSMFDIFKYSGTVELQQLIEILNLIDKDLDPYVYESYLDHYSECLYPDNVELKIYVSIYKLLRSIESTLNIDTLYDPRVETISLFINNIMILFGYEAVEITE
jgi:hypothetical protein